MPKTILVAEDSKTIQRAVQLTFRPEEFKVVPVSTLAEASSVAATADVAIISARLNGDQGYQLCRRLRSLYQFPVIMLTSNFVKYDEAEGSSAGVSAYIDKPFETQALINLVQQLLGLEVSEALPLSYAASLAPKAPSSVGVINKSFKAPAPAAPSLAPAPSMSPAPAVVTPSMAPRPKAAKSKSVGVPEMVIEDPEEIDDVDLIEIDGDSMDLQASGMSGSLEPPVPPSPQPKGPRINTWEIEEPEDTGASIDLIGGAPSLEPPPRMPPPRAVEPTPAPAPRPVVAAPAPAPQPSRREEAVEAMAKAAAPAIVAQAVSASPMAEALPQAELERIAREAITEIAWEVVPELAEVIIRAELERLTQAD